MSSGLAVRLEHARAQIGRHLVWSEVDMAIAQGVLKLHRRQAGRAPHHSIDIFFESLAGTSANVRSG